METMNHICKLADRCNKAGVEGVCSMYCSPFILLHGLNGNTGLWKSANVPAKYSASFFSNLPIKADNPVAYGFISKYVKDVSRYVSEGVGLFLYSIPTQSNRFGTGTGKTTAATCIANEYLLNRIIDHSKGTKLIEQNPVLFYKASELQNMYNAQFRGTPEMQDQASRKYYHVKKLMMAVDLLILDDVGIRSKITDAFENELTEIIDTRDSRVLATIYTSNLPIEKLADTLGDRIASRIEGMTEQIAFTGQDHRKGGLL